MTRREIAEIRLKAASEHVENAQHELERAISALGSLQWMASEQAKVSTLRDRIHEAFYRIAPVSHIRAKACAKAELDREPEADDEEPHRGCCPGRAILVRAESPAARLTTAAAAFARKSNQVALTCERTLRGEGDCEGARFIEKGTVDITTSGHTDQDCPTCSGPMVVVP